MKKPVGLVCLADLTTPADQWSFFEEKDGRFGWEHENGYYIYFDKNERRSHKRMYQRALQWLAHVAEKNWAEPYQLSRLGYAMLNHIEQRKAL